MRTNLVRVGNTWLPEPSEYIGNTADIVDSARNLNGVMIGSVIRYGVAKVECKWRYLTAKQWSDVLKLFSPKHGGAFENNVYFYNQTTGEWETRLMYVSDRNSGGAFKTIKSTGEVQGWVECRIALVEV